MLALLAALLLAPLLYIPGFLLISALARTAQSPDPLERHYERTLAGALLNGWLALTLAELGVFSAGLHLALITFVCLAAGARLWRAKTRHASQETGAAAHVAPPVSRIPAAQYAFLAVLLLFAALVAQPFEVVLGARDAGVYANTGFAIARNGGIVQRDNLVLQLAEDKRSADPQLAAAAVQAETNLLGIQPASRFVATRMRFSGFLINSGDLASGQVTPQFLHLYPAWIGLLASLLGLKGGLLATSLLGLLGVWSVGMLGRRLAGDWVGLLGMLFLALNGAQVWFSRYSTSEACAQFLSFAALYGFAVMQMAREDRGSRIKDSGPDSAQRNPRSSILNSRRSLVGLLAGLAAGQLALTRIDFFILLAPLLASLGYAALTRRWSRAHWWLLLGLGAMLLHAALHIVFVARAYFLDTLYARLQDQSAIVAWLAYALWTPALRQQFLDIPRSAALRAPYRLPLEIGLLALFAVAIVLLRRDGRPQRAFERLVLRRKTGLLRLGAVVLLLLGIYGYLVRPQILTSATLAAAPSCTIDRSTPACLTLQGYVGAPIAVPAHPNAVAYALGALPKLLRGQPAAVASVPARADDELREAPARGAQIGQVRVGEQLQLLGKDSHDNRFLVRDTRRVLGWVLSSTLTLDQPALGALPVQADNLVDRVGNPREATSFSFGNPGESEKIGIAQANLVRVGWYLSPLGMLLAIVGAALWWRRGLNGASWLFLVASIASTFFFARLSYGTSDLTYIYILRRYIPLSYPALSLAMAYAAVAITRRPTTDDRPRKISGASIWRNIAGGRWPVVVAAGLALAQLAFFIATSRQIYRHAEYAGALDQLEALAGQFAPGDVLIFRGEGRDTPDLVATPLQYAFGLNTFAVRSDNPGKYAAQLADYVRRWQAQGRQVYLVLGANGGLALPGLRALPVGPAALHLPEFQQLRDQKPSAPLEFAFDFVVYRLEAGEAPAEPGPVEVGDFTAQLAGFYHPEQIGGATVAWTGGDALLRLPWPQDNAPHVLRLRLAPGASRPAALGPARACLAQLPALDLALPTQPFADEQCFELGAGMQEYRYTLNPRGLPAPGSGTVLLRISSPTWVPAEADPAQHDQRRLGVQFGGVDVP